ncbi:uncharacterized protein IWZ02DRAFT_434734 [Phyllosticta citriasiana]|uniref:Uncharacterized protein n=1 Tax=Phyllosticta citriasiana TaxID=595635 RepID=A0ABR1KXR0_9PEZI
MKFTTATFLLAATSASPALSQVFTITGTRIPSDAVHAATLVKDGITIITGTRIPTAAANANINAADIPISLSTAIHTPTTFETRFQTPSPLLQARASSPAPAGLSAAINALASEAPAPIQSSAPGITVAPAPTQSSMPATSVPAIKARASPSPKASVSPAAVKARAADNVFVEKRCLALGAECGNNGVYTDCCDDQLCAENHGTGSLTCGGVSV